MINPLLSFKSFMDIKYPESKASKYSQDEYRRHTIVNYISFITMLTMLSYVAIYALLDFQFFIHPIIFLSSCSVVAFGIIIVNKQGYYNSAKIMNAIMIPFFMTYIAAVVYNKEPGFHVYLLLSAMIPLFMWSFRDKKYLFVFIPINVLLYLTIEFLPPVFDARIILSDNYVNGFKRTNIFGCFAGAGFAVGIYQYYANSREKLLYAQKEELRLSQAHKDKIHSIIAHDLRGPMEGLISITNLMIERYDDFDDQKRIKIINDIKNSTASMSDLTVNLLDWSKVYSGIIKKKRINVNIIKTLDNIIKLFDNQINKKNIYIKADLSPNIYVNADEHMISAIFRNLISNALKYTPENGKILITAKPLNSKIEFCISDSGIGISKADQLNLFDIQKNDTTLGTNEERGSGLGLNLCKEFVEENDGNIRVESDVGKGSHFFFTLNKST